VAYLLDTNLVSELRKGIRCNRGVQQWRLNVAHEETFLSVIVMGELRQGIEKLRTRDSAGAHHLDGWFSGIKAAFAGQILPVTSEICHIWGVNPLLWPLQTADALIAATAIQHTLTVVTNNERDFQRSGVDFVNPFKA
jgi:toxin FitB